MIPWGQRKVVNKVLQPHILGQPNIPKALHGINPRTIMGSSAWGKLRLTLIHNNPYCVSCGLETLTLDLHESYDIDYSKYILTLKEYVCLCRKCHMFIHSGYLSTAILDKKYSTDEAKDILASGINICAKNNIAVFAVGYDISKKLGIDVSNVKRWYPKNADHWGSWVLHYNNKTYKGLTQKQWKKKYEI